MKTTIAFHQMVAVAAPARPLSDEFNRILLTYNQTGREYLPQKDINFLINNMASLGVENANGDPDELTKMLDEIIKRNGLPDRNQLAYIRIRGAKAVQNLPDMTEAAQDYCIRNNIGVSDLIDKVKTLSRISANLLQEAVTRSSNEDTLKYLLFKQDKQLSGLGLRIRIFEQYPELVKVIPNPDGLTLNEKKTIIRTNPELLQVFKQRPASLVRLYKSLTNSDGDPHFDFDESLGQVNSLLIQLKNAKLSNDTAKVAKITEELNRLKDYLSQVVEPEQKPEQATKKVQDEPAKKVAIDRNHLVSYRIKDESSGEIYLVLNHYLVRNLSELPLNLKVIENYVPQDLSDFSVLRLLKSGQKVNSLYTFMVVRNSGLKNLIVVGKVSDQRHAELLDLCTNSDYYSKVLKVVNSVFDQVQVKSTPAPKPQEINLLDTSKTSPVSAPTEAPTNIVNEVEGMSVDVTKGLQHMDSVVKTLAKLSKQIGKLGTAV